MRPTNMRYPRTLRLTAGALAIAAPTSAALAAGPPPAQSTLQVKPAPNRLKYGEKLTVTGLAPRSAAGQRLALEFSAARHPWRTVASTRVHANGAFRLRAPLAFSGQVRVASAPAPATHAVNGPGVGTPPGVSTSPGAALPGAAALAASQPQPVAVAAKLVTSTRTVDALSGRPVEVRGVLVPRGAGRLVRLEGRARGGWRTLAVARTRASGSFVMRYADKASAQQTVRLSFAGDAGNAGVTSVRRQVVPLQPAVASWYQDGGNTACGFHAGNGIANKALPCGTKVTLAYHGRTVTAVVDDRGPFVPGREYDLNQTTASALGFGGVDTVWSFVQPPAPAAHHRPPSSAHRRLHRKCSRAASHTSTWTRSTCRSSSGAARSFGPKPWSSPAAVHVR